MKRSEREIERERERGRWKGKIINWINEKGQGVQEVRDRWRGEVEEQP